MTAKHNDKYSAENIMSYKTAIAFIDLLERQGVFTAKDKAEMYTVIGDKYGFDSCSIFAE